MIDIFSDLCYNSFTMAESAVSNQTGGDTNETHSDAERGHPEGQRRQGRLRRVPDLLPVRLQDQLRHRQSAVRERPEVSCSDKNAAHRAAFFLSLTTIRDGKEEGKMMDEEWKRLYEEAMRVLDPHDVSNKMWVGSVASAVLTKKGNIYKGICIDTDGSIGMCAERNALSTMLTYGESEITKVVSVYKDGNIIPSCGICREFMMHLGGDVENIEILLDKEGRTTRLIDLMPEYPRHK